jgi:hypothetical protein
MSTSLHYPRESFRFLYMPGASHISLSFSLPLSSQVNGEMHRHFRPVPLGCRCMLIPNPPVALRRSRTGVAYEVAYTRAGNVITDRLGSEDLVVAVPIEAAVPV